MRFSLFLLCMLCVLVCVARAAPAPERQFEVRCRATVPFRYRSGAAPWQESQSNQQRLPLMGPDGQSLVYDFEVDARRDFWHRYTFSIQGVRAVEYASYGLDFTPTVTLDVPHVVLTAVLPLAVVVPTLLGALRRGRRLRRELDETRHRLSGLEQGRSIGADGTVPDRIDDYTVQGPLGAGGMAVVYRVQRDGQTYALKLPSPTLLQDADLRARFIREMRIGCTLSHRNLIHLVDVSDGSGTFRTPYIVMELVEGVSLKERMAATPALGPGEIVRIGRGLLDALAYIHGRGIVHRDVKPGNVMLAPNGLPRLMDFGVAWRAETMAGRLTGTRDVPGTPVYLAPEQLRGDGTVHASADIYAVGIILYEALAGRLPWPAQDPMALMVEKLTEDPQPLEQWRPDVSPALCAVIMQMLARDPQERFGDARATAAALEQAEG